MTVKPSLSPTNDPWLLTPGPLTTSPTVKQAMLHDFGSRDHGFIAVNRRMRERLLEIVHGQGTHVAVPLQGSGTFVVEAMIATFLPASGKLLVLVNGAYGRRMVKMCEVAGHAHAQLEWAEDQPVDPAKVETALAADQSITHVAVVHCETTSGVLNPVKAVAEVVQRQGRRLLIDAMSAFGALAIDARSIPFDAVVASSNKCLEGVPGIGFCLARKAALEETKGNCPSLSLDLYDQWFAMEGNGQWRFTPPTHAILAFDQALGEFEAEGGQPGRGGRYAENCKILVEGMRALGFQTLLPDRLQAPIIVTFLMPSDPKFHFQSFYDRLRERGFVIYPGKLTVADTFRIGCIGRLGRAEMEGALAAIRAVLGEMGVTRCAPKAAA
ncbi:MAG TPA: 2-aminoethylphosphonate--pyruvate transaminase [Kiloniellales bacterium]|nr:2-aminoethylphosphonate--pyruvate transaminase [Kiloniellales bacterium]